MSVGRLMMNFKIDRKSEKLLKAEPELFIERTITRFARSSPFNRLNDVGGARIFESPLIGFADGDDRLFHEYKKVVHEHHLLPREVLERHLNAKPVTPPPCLDNVSVISFVFPVNRKTVRSNACEKEGPCLSWNHTRWKGQAFINEVSSHLAAALASLGFYAVAPELENFFNITLLPDGLTSNWSQRHAAYAAGLGTFSLNEGFITPKGLAMRCGSVVTNLNLTPSVRSYANYLENCLFYTTGGCGKCVSRCPGGALSKSGHDKLKCLNILFEQQKPWLEGLHGPGYMGSYAGCGLCQTGVPCATQIPVKKKKMIKANSGSQASGGKRVLGETVIYRKTIEGEYA